MNQTLEPGEQELLRNLGAFAARHAQCGNYLTTFYHLGLGTKILLLVSLGEQADAAHRILLNSAMPDEAVIVNTSGGKDFLDGNH